ncbi:LOW protein: exocyst complex component-like protein [Perilla frutescens var. hirtella]|uniref:LOW protein: exocyst complex component-like protein n=1 Tax=Perilla frutescens var. hirtella TaxID=608512 RepID=A0AAD4IQI1_PERFH|nr:LOW protein: exocyst complex component-like protein [Perilla frutescens var. hirtella]
MVESSEEEDDFPSMESVTPQSKIDTVYQSKTEKGIRKICFELLDLKDAVENLCSNTRTKYLAFLRLSDEVVEMKHELNELQKHISAHGIFIQDLMSGVSHELEEWSRAGGDALEADDNAQTYEADGTFSTELEDRRMQFLEHVDVLLAEHKIEEAIDAIDAEERSHPELKGSGDSATDECSSFKSALLKRKNILENQLIEISRQPSVGILELKTVLSGLLKLGKGPLAHQIFLKSYGSRLQRSIEDFIALCPCYPETYSATLSNLVFSMISLATKDSGQMFGDNPLYSNKIVQWAEWEIESLVRLVKENAPPSETSSALRATSVFVQASLNHCSALEKQDLKLTKLLLVLLQPYVEEVLELNFRRARKVALDLVGSDESMPLSPRFASPLSTFATSSDRMLVDCGMRFIFAVKEIVEQLTRLVILHFGGNILTRISQLFDKYVEVLVKSLTGPTEDDNLTELKEPIPFKAETDSQQLALLGTAFTIAEELLPMVMSKIWNVLSESKDAGDGLIDNIMPSNNSTVDPKEWRRQIQQSLDKLRDHFCRQYVLSFIYSRDGETRLDAQIYIGGKGKDLIWNSDPLPSLPFQALFGKLQQLATVAGDVLLGKERIQKVLLARLTETVVMWLSNEEEFWGVLEHDSAPLHPIGLQQLMLDMHFTVEIARFAGYPPRHLNKISSDIIARAVKAFSARGIDPQSSLLDDEWFVETAKGAINKLLTGGSGSDVSEIDEEDEHIIMDDEVVSDSDDGSPSSLSSVESEESFASAQMEELESPVLTDSEN